MLRKKESYTVITPIPGFIPRQLAIDILHSHSEVITLNPLVTDHKPIPAPRDAAADEFYSTWYEIHQRVQVVPGVGKIGSSKISFNGCFHDMPWGLQTHIYAPFNIDMRNKYTIAGNQPGIEPPENREIGLEALGAPKDGLYLREDIEIKCNITMTSFVKTQSKAASKEMVQRIIKKAELLDAGILQAMMHEGRLKTHNPNDRSSMMPPEKMGSPPPTSTSPGFPPSYDQSNPASPRASNFPASPNMGYARPQSYAPGGYQQYPPQNGPSPGPYQQGHAGVAQQGYGQTPPPQQGHGEKPPQSFPVEMPGDYTHQQQTQGPQSFTAELPAQSHPQ